MDFLTFETLICCFQDKQLSCMNTKGLVNGFLCSDFLILTFLSSFQTMCSSGWGTLRGLKAPSHPPLHQNPVRNNHQVSPGQRPWLSFTELPLGGPLCRHVLMQCMVRKALDLNPLYWYSSHLIFRSNTNRTLPYRNTWRNTQKVGAHNVKITVCFWFYPAIFVERPPLTLDVPYYGSALVLSY